MAATRLVILVVFILLPISVMSAPAIIAPIVAIILSAVTIVVVILPLRRCMCIVSVSILMVLPLWWYISMFLWMVLRRLTEQLAEYNRSMIIIQRHLNQFTQLFCGVH